MTSSVTQTPAAPSDLAQQHFAAMLGFETDCWDTHESLEMAAQKGAEPDFILVDVRSPDMYAKGHVPGAINLLHGKMIGSRMAQFPKDKLFVVYCAGPHCNGANKAALRLSRLGLPVKMMIGGITGWLDEGFALTAPGDTEPGLVDIGAVGVEA
ncbi:rhodanese-like domain-containing protein [Kiloniella laminariae]|uniref:rhodanese-like domain-containing protein n=1 Tax=Kiloniella laminariae TaxID=454162 RepID=UPI00036454E7|nr:rhodanese-like domain-containing protein [Kiloniella laminariae]